MEYFQDGIEWVGDHTNFTSKGVCEAANSSHCYKCYVYDKDFYESFEIILNYIVMLTSATGLVGNFLSIYVLTKTGLCSRFSNLLIMLAYADISYLSMKEVTSVIKCFDLHYDDKNLMNLYHVMYPYFLHPMYKIIQLTTVFITMILSIDRYVVVFYPYLIYGVNGCLRTLLRGPKREHVPPYFISLIVVSSLLCLPHFFVFESVSTDGSKIETREYGLYSNFYCRLIYFSILDPFIRTILPIIILSFSNLRLLFLINKDSSWPDNHHHHHHHHKVYTLLAVVFFFIIFNFPYLIVIVWDLLDFHRLLACQEIDKHIGYSTVNLVYTDIVSYLLVCNSSINFVLYVLFAPKFRLIVKRDAHKLLCWRSWREKNYHSSVFTITRMTRSVKY